MLKNEIKNQNNSDIYRKLLAITIYIATMHLIQYFYLQTRCFLFFHRIHKSIDIPLHEN